MFFGAVAGFGLAGELRLPDFGLFMRERLQERVITVYDLGVCRPEISAAVREVREEIKSRAKATPRPRYQTPEPGAPYALF